MCKCAVAFLPRARNEENIGNNLVITGHLHAAMHVHFPKIAERPVTCLRARKVLILISASSPRSTFKSHELGQWTGHAAETGPVRDLDRLSRSLLGVGLRAFGNSLSYDMAGIPCLCEHECNEKGGGRPRHNPILVAARNPMELPA